MQRSAWWLGVAAGFSILAEHCAAGQASEYRPPTENAVSQGAADAHRKLPADRAGSRLRHVLRDQVNSGLVTIILGGLDSGVMSDATDLVTTLGGAHLRVLPVAGQGATKDVIDLLFARGIDVGVVHTDVLSALKRQAPFPGIDVFLQYIAKLYDEEIHILASSEIHSLQDLASKRVNFGTTESESFFTASTIFNVLGIGVDITTLPQPVALSKLRSGEIAALGYTVAKPARLFEAIRPEEGFHFLSISAPGALRESYGEATLSAADYPALVEQDKPVSTLSVGTVLAAYNWPSGTERYRNVAHFVETFFGRLAELRMSRHHPKWREVNIEASVPGWTRFAPASQWIKSAEGESNKPTNMAGDPLATEGSTTSPAQVQSAGSGDLEPSRAEPATKSASIDFNGEPPLPPSTAKPQEPRAQINDQVSLNAGQRDALFREFLEYEKQQTQKAEHAPSQKEALFAEFQAYVKHVSRALSGKPPTGPERVQRRLPGWL